MKAVKPVRLLAVGDIMLGDHPVCIGHGVRSQMEKRGAQFPFQLVSSFLKQGDMTFGNLEVALSDAGYDPNRLESAELRGKPVFAEALAANGFNILSVANNHALQHGDQAFEETIANLNTNGISSVGLRTDNGYSNVVEFSGHGVRIGFVSYSLRPEKYYKGPVYYAVGDNEAMCRQITDLSNAFDAVVISLHWGEEYMNYPSHEQVMLAHRLIDCGGLVILGHHPHVLQGVERYKGGLIAYSLGNFIFDKWQRNPRESMILDVDIGKSGIKRWNWWPVFINGMYQPQIVVGRLAEEIRKKMEGYSSRQGITKPNHPQITLDEYERNAQRAYLRFRISSYVYFLINIFRYSPNMVRQSLNRALCRRKLS